MSLPDIDIAHSANMKNIAVIGDQLGFPKDSLLSARHHKAKIDYDFIAACVRGQAGQWCWTYRHRLRRYNDHAGNAKNPAANAISPDHEGEIQGLF